VHERLDVVAVGLHPGAVLVGEGPGGELLGRTSAAFGVARLSVDRLLAPAQEHRFSTLSMSLGQSAAPALGVGASEGEGDPLLLHTTEVSAEPRFAPHSVRRILYRETFWFPLGARILGVARLGQQLAVLTEHELRLSRISNGRWRTSVIRLLRSPVALASVGEHLAVACADVLRLLNDELRTV